MSSNTSSLPNSENSPTIAESGVSSNSTVANDNSNNQNDLAVQIVNNVGQFLINQVQQSPELTNKLVTMIDNNTTSLEKAYKYLTITSAALGVISFGIMKLPDSVLSTYKSRIIGIVGIAATVTTFLTSLIKNVQSKNFTNVGSDLTATIHKIDSQLTKSDYYYTAETLQISLNTFLTPIGAKAEIINNFSNISQIGKNTVYISNTIESIAKKDLNNITIDSKAKTADQSKDRVTNTEFILRCNYGGIDTIVCCGADAKAKLDSLNLSTPVVDLTNYLTDSKMQMAHIFALLTNKVSNSDVSTDITNNDTKTAAYKFLASVITDQKAEAKAEQTDKGLLGTGLLKANLVNQAKQSLYSDNVQPSSTTPNISMSVV